MVYGDSGEDIGDCSTFSEECGLKSAFGYLVYMTMLQIPPNNISGITMCGYLCCQVQPRNGAVYEDAAGAFNSHHSM